MTTNDNYVLFEFRIKILIHILIPVCYQLILYDLVGGEFSCAAKSAYLLVAKPFHPYIQPPFSANERQAEVEIHYTPSDFSGGP